MRATFLLALLLAAGSARASDPFALWRNPACSAYKSAAPHSAEKEAAAAQTPLSAVGDRYTSVPLAPEPPSHDVVGVRENHTASNRNGPFSRNYLATYDLLSCVAVTIYDPVTKVGTVSHFYPGRYQKPLGTNTELLAQYAAHVRQQFSAEGGKFDRAQVTMVWGTGSRQNLSPVVNELVKNFSEAKPAQLAVDAREVPRASRAIALDLRDGQVKELTPTRPDGRWNPNTGFDWSRDKPHPR